jgi:hypothetical protein
MLPSKHVVGYKERPSSDQLVFQRLLLAHCGAGSPNSVAAESSAWLLLMATSFSSGVAVLDAVGSCRQSI